MKKILKEIKKNKKIIFCFCITLALLALFLCFSNSSYALSNPEYYSADDKSLFESALQWFMQKILGLGVGVLGKAISPLINLVNVIIFSALYSIAMAGGATNGLKFPFPDQIVFNGIPMLDPNFINPTNDAKAIVNIMSSTIQKLYYSFFSLAGTVFVLAAVIIGIKLAFSSIASEKAQYKDAIKHWLTGLAALFLMHFILAGMFAINEQVCISASKLCNKVSIKIDFIDDVTSVGSTIKGAISTVAGWFSDDAANAINDSTKINVSGYGGVLLKFVLRGLLKSDIIYSIGLSIMLGQTFTLLMMYFKRVFYCIILGMIAPLVVAMDTIQKVVTGRDSGVLKNWFQNMIAIIFNQSFQAIFMCISVLIIGKFSGNDDSSDIIIALISVVTLNAIMKFDKLFKEILGIKDSKIMGGFNENAMRSFAAIKSGMALAKRSAEPFANRAEARRRYNVAAKKREKALKSLSELGSGAKTNSSSSGIVNNFNGGSASNTLSNGTNSVNANGIGGVSGGNLQMIEAMNNLSRALDKNTSSKEEEKREKLTADLAEAEGEMAKARADQKAESLKAFTRFGTTLGSLGFGMGATNNLGDAVSVGNLVDMPMDKMTDRAVNRGVYGNTARKIDSNRDQLIDKYVKSGISHDAAAKAVDTAISNINSQIPEALGKAMVNTSLDAIKATGDVISRKGKKYSKEVQKKLYSSDNIDNI